jgi:carboxymethylenebutenolidase
MDTRLVTIPGAGGGEFDVHVVLPEQIQAPALIIVSSIFGVTPGLQRTMRRYAERGFIVAAPDIFWRTHPGPLTEDEQPAAEVRIKDYDILDGLDDVRRTREYIRDLPQWNGKFAVVGFCFGGWHTFLAMTRLGADAGVTFHGSRIHRFLDEVNSVVTPFSFHYASDDPVVPLEQVDKIRAALAGKVGEIVVYEGTHHGFAREEASHYDPEAARISEERAFVWLDALATQPIA